MKTQDRTILRTESHNSSMVNLINAKENFKPSAPFVLPSAPKSIDVKNDKTDFSENWYRSVFSGSGLFRARETEPSVHSALSMSSRFSYFQDRVLAPEGT
jgi:hypothetical protein